MKKLLVSLFFFSMALPAFAQAQQQPGSEVGRYIEAYSGPRQEVVWVLRVGPRENKEVLVQISGVDHELDQTVLKCTIKEEKHIYYVTELNGKPFELLVRRLNSDLSLDNSMLLFLPGVSGSIELKYDKDLSMKGNPQRFKRITS